MTEKCKFVTIQEKETPGKRRWSRLVDAGPTLGQGASLNSGKFEILKQDNRVLSLCDAMNSQQAKFMKLCVM